MKSTSNVLDRYLDRLRTELAGIDSAEVDDIVLELRSHVLDRVASGETADESIGRLGDPVALARLYRSQLDMDRARASFSPWTVLRGALRWGMVSWMGYSVFVFGLVGYGLGLGFMASAILKPFFPDRVGFWISGRGAVFGVTDSSSGAEVLGWWIIPLGLVLGVLYLIGVTLVLRWILKNFGRIRNPRSLFASSS